MSPGKAAHRHQFAAPLPPWRGPHHLSLFSGAAGHPPLISRTCVADLPPDWEGGLGAFLSRYDGEAQDLEVIDEAVLLDCDTPEDYRRLLSQKRRKISPPGLNVRGFGTGTACLECAPPPPHGRRAGRDIGQPSELRRSWTYGSPGGGRGLPPRPGQGAAGSRSALVQLSWRTWGTAAWRGWWLLIRTSRWTNSPSPRRSCFISPTSSSLAIAW